MSENEQSESQGLDSCDLERQFYTVMQHGLNGEKLLDWSDYMFDASEGTQSGVTPDGNAAVLVVADPEASKKIISALEHWQEHACEPSIETALALLFVIGVHLQKLDLGA